jgi:hydrogenase maturation protease
VRGRLSVAARVLIGGVGYRWCGDASFGLVATDELAPMPWRDGVRVEDLGYGALHAAMDLADADPPYERVILIGATERGRQPGRLYRFRCDGRGHDREDVQARMYEAGAGVIDLDHLVVIGRQFSALPDDVVAIELEPDPGTTGDALSPGARALLPELIDLIRHEVDAAVDPASI